MKRNNRPRKKSSDLSLYLAFVGLVASSMSVSAQTSENSDSHWQGRDVFRQKGCIQCHAVYGEGGKGGPDLGKRQFYGTYLELAALMWNHFPGMAKKSQKPGYQFTELTKDDMPKLLSYLAHIRHLGEPGNVWKGKKLLRTKGCTKCHKFGGEGGDIGPDISAIKEYIAPLALVESMWNHGPSMAELFEEHNIKRPEFKGNEFVDLTVAIRSYMSPSLVAIRAFTSGDPAKGEKLAAEKGCLRCHAVRGTGGELGPDFAEVDFNCSTTQIAGKMWNHGPTMWEIMKSENIAFPIFEKGEIVDIIAYIYDLGLEDPAGDADAGLKIVKERACLTCHPLQGKGRGVAASLETLGELKSPLEMIAAMWNHAPAMQQRLQKKKLKWPQFNGRDMANLYAYLRALSQQTTTQK